MGRGYSGNTAEVFILFAHCVFDLVTSRFPLRTYFRSQKANNRDKIRKFFIINNLMFFSIMAKIKQYALKDRTILPIIKIILSNPPFQRQSDLIILSSMYNLQTISIQNRLKTNDTYSSRASIISN